MNDNCYIASPEDSLKILYLLRPFLPRNPENFPCLPNNKHWFCDFFHEQEELMEYEDFAEFESFRKYHEKLKEKFDVMSKDSGSVDKPLFVIFETPCNIYQGHEKICTDPFSSDNLLSTQHLSFYTNLLSTLYSDSGTLPATLRKARESMSPDEFEGVLIETLSKILRIPVFPLVCPYHIVSTPKSDETPETLLEVRHFFEDMLYEDENLLLLYSPKTLESKNLPLLSFHPSVFDRQEAKGTLPYILSEDAIRFNFYLLANAFYHVVDATRHISASDEEKIVVISKKTGYAARVIERVCKKMDLGVTNLELMRNHDGFSLLGECDPTAIHIIEGYELSLLEKVLYT